MSCKKSFYPKENIIHIGFFSYILLVGIIFYSPLEKILKGTYLTYQGRHIKKNGYDIIFLRNGLLGSIYGFQNYILSGCKNCHLGTGKIKGHLLFYFHLRSFVFLKESYGVNTMNKLAMTYLSLSLPISWVFPKNPYV